MSINAWITLIITVAAAVCLIFEILRPDIIALLTLVLIGLFQLIPIQDVFSGFSSSVVITLISIYILSAALQTTGAAYWLGTQLYRFSGSSSTRLILATMLASASLSLFMNNVAVIGILLPAVLTLAGKANVPVRRLLLPLAYGTILGGMATLLTTSNLIVSSALEQAGYAPFSIADFFPIGFPAIALGVLYMILVDRMDRRKSIDNLPHNKEIPYLQRLLQQYQLQGKFNLLQIKGSDSNNLIKKTDLGDLSFPGQTLLAILRKKRLIPLNHCSDSGLLARDEILTLGDQIPSLAGSNPLITSQNPVDIQQVLNGVYSLHEVSVPAHMQHDRFPNCQDIPAMQTGQLIPLAVSRQGQVITGNLLDLSPLEGDSILCFGDYAGLMDFQQQTHWQISQMDPNTIQKPGKGWQAFIITTLTILAAVIDLLPVHLAILCGAVLLILSGCIDQKKIYQMVDWQTIFLIAGLWPLGLAIKASGLAEMLIQILNLNQFIGTPWVIGGAILLLSMMFTQLIGGQVAGIISIPITLSIAQATHLDPRGLGMAAALGCTFVFLMPFSHPVNLMATRAGNITVKEFLKIGLPFFIFLFLWVVLGLHFFWGL